MFRLARVRVTAVFRFSPFTPLQRTRFQPIRGEEGGEKVKERKEGAR